MAAVGGEQSGSRGIRPEAFQSLEVGRTRVTVKTGSQETVRSVVPTVKPNHIHWESGNHTGLASV